MGLFRDDACQNWSICRAWIEDACNNGDGWWTVQALVDMLCEGRAVLWVLKNDETPVAAVVTAIADHDGERVAEIIAAGILAGIETELPKVEAWAVENRATSIVLRGRRGWSRAYKSQGYEEIAVTMRKAL
jgi:hypothetical protein